jgi:hypothetical protein
MSKGAIAAVMSVAAVASVVAAVVVLTNKSRGYYLDSMDLPDDWQKSTAFETTSRRTAQLVQCQGCDELESMIKKSIEQEYRVQLIHAANDIYNSNIAGGMDMPMEELASMVPSAEWDAPAPSPSPTLGPAPREEGRDFSGTNNQEAGVDEADFVKTDGQFIYYLLGGDLRILGVPQFGQLTLESTLAIEGTPTAMVLDGNSLVILSSLSPRSVKDSPLASALGWAQGIHTVQRRWPIQGLTKFTVVDVSDRKHPKPQRNLYIEGGYLTAREVGGTIRAVTHARMNIPYLKNYLDLPNSYYGLDRDDPQRAVIRDKVAYATILENEKALTERLGIGDILPRVYELAVPGSGGGDGAGGELTTHAPTAEACANFAFPEDGRGRGRGVTSIFTLKLGGGGGGGGGSGGGDSGRSGAPFDVDHLVGNYPQVRLCTGA